MNYKNLFFSFFILCFSLSLYAQKTEANYQLQKEYLKAIALFENEAYISAQAIFDDLQYQNHASQIAYDASYYFAVCAIRLNQSQAEQSIEQFLKDYPTNPRQNTIYLDAGDYYFANAKYARAQKWYKNVKTNTLPASKKEQFYFNNGYVNYVTKNYKEAKQNLSKVEYSDVYGAQAKYYLGFMSYEVDDYDSASKYLEQVSEQERYKNEINYFQADLNFKLGAFQKALDMAKKALEMANKKETSELSKIIGESYFNLKKYNDAIPYLKAYKGKKGKWTNLDFYQLGYAYYKQNNFENAIGEFNKIINGKNAIAQNAYYHLGESYINLDKKQEALNAFRSASEMDFNDNIKEDAWLNYAKLSYDIGNPYMSTPQVLSDFLKTYPKSTFRETIESFLVDSYISSKNYKEALSILESNMRNALKASYQKVAFFRALELYNYGDYSEAQLLFKKAINIGLDPSITARATYWNAEIEFLNLNFDNALQYFLSFKNSSVALQSPEHDHLNYNLGYTYLKLKKYEKAITAFQSYVSNSDENKTYINDAFLRMADAYFVSKLYNKAIDAYAKVIKNKAPSADYATFQTAVSYGFLGQIEPKLSHLRQVLKYKNSTYLDQVHFELANTYSNQNKVQKAIQEYDVVINNFKKSALVSKALLRKGLLLYNANATAKALDVFKRVAKEYPSTPESFQAIGSARSIYIDNGNVEDYAKWISTLKYVAITDSDIEKTSYESAEKQYLDQNTEKAISLFNGYISSFPKGTQIIKAHYYLGALYFKQNLKQNALPHYEYVLEQSANEFTEQALQKVCVIKLQSKDDVELYLKRLELEAKSPQNILFAQSNLMKIAYKKKAYSFALDYAKIILENPNTDDYIKNDAHIITARSAFALGDENLAKTSYSTVASLGSSNYGAEAQYYAAFFHKKDQDYKASNQMIQQLIQQFPSQKEFAAKGLILMAQNYYALNDAFQATYILENVVKNFSEFTELKTEAMQLLETYERELSKSNASIEPELQNTKKDEK